MQQMADRKPSHFLNRAELQDLRRLPIVDAVSLQQALIRMEKAAGDLQMLTNPAGCVKGRGLRTFEAISLHICKSNVM